ncbi:MAG: hypothetical protein B7Z55_19125 [Planctomycetales bacterium 12-60-4]|nr:MAG: hypothetical protein B7Z55_19125 [Planctomycetales bacterium 12-60-4]
MGVCPAKHYEVPTMKWLSRLFGGRQIESSEPDTERLVPDEEYDFGFGTKPLLPEGLRNLKITELRRGLLVLENFEIDLTVDQNYMDVTPERIAMASRCLRWAQTYHGLDAPPQPPLRLHRGNVLVTASHYDEQHRPDDDIVQWLEHFRWDTARPFRIQQVTTGRPLEDGYFSCIRVLANDSAGDDEPPLAWSERARVSSVVDGLTAFVRDEVERVEQHWSCEELLRKCYEPIPREQLTHPVFALLDFPVFDMGTVNMTFSGSICSENELRFWSRPTYYHK